MATLSAEGDTCNDQVLYLGTELLNNFIYEWICRHGDCDAEVARTQLGQVELSDPNQKCIAQCLQQIADDIEKTVELRQMLDMLLCQDWSSIENVFHKVSLVILSDGFNWGRVVALFYLACQIVIKAILRKIKPEAIRDFISWTMSHIQEHASNWIREQGGWEGIFSYFGTPTWQIIGILLAGVLATVLVIRKM